MKSNQSRAGTRAARSSCSPLVCDFYVLAVDNDDDGMGDGDDEDVVAAAPAGSNVHCVLKCQFAPIVYVLALCIRSSFIAPKRAVHRLTLVASNCHFRCQAVDSVATLPPPIVILNAPRSMLQDLLTFGMQARFFRRSRPPGRRGRFSKEGRLKKNKQKLKKSIQTLEPAAERAVHFWN